MWPLQKLKNAASNVGQQVKQMSTNILQVEQDEPITQETTITELIQKFNKNDLPNYQKHFEALKDYITQTNNLKNQIRSNQSQDLMNNTTEFPINYELQSTLNWDQLKSRLNKLTVDILDLSKMKYAPLVSENKVLKQKFQAVQDQSKIIDSLKEEKEYYKNQQVSLSLEFTQVEKQLQQEIAQLQEKIQNYEKTPQTQEVNQNVHEEVIKALQSVKQQVSDQYELMKNQSPNKYILQQECQQLFVSVEKIIDSVASCEISYSDELQLHIQQLDNQILQEKQTILTLTNQNNQIKQSIKHKLKNILQKMDQLKQEQIDNSVQSQYNQMREYLNDLTTQIQNKLTLHQDEVQQASQEHDEIKQSSILYNEELAKFQINQEQMKNQFEENIKQNELHYKNQLQGNYEQIEKLNMQIEDLQIQLIRKQSEIDDLTLQLTIQLSNVKESQFERDTVRRHIKELKESLAMLKGQNLMEIVKEQQLSLNTYCEGIYNQIKSFKSQDIVQEKQEQMEQQLEQEVSTNEVQELQKESMKDKPLLQANQETPNNQILINQQQEQLLKLQEECELKQQAQFNVVNSIIQKYELEIKEKGSKKCKISPNKVLADLKQIKQTYL